MRNKKTKLFYSIISLLLCVSMLMGTTFAWFTDSVTTGINTIAAGNLDIELYHSNAAVNDERVNTNTQLFMDLQGQPILWEPGVVSYENLRVVNEGDLALVYQLSINTAGENFVLDPANNTQYGLSQILKIGIVEDGITATDRDGVLASVGDNWIALDAFLRSGSLLPAAAGESEKTWGVVIYWQPGERDNDWNLNNGKTLSSGDALSIELGVKLIATQEQHESDSFGSDYDTTAKTDFFPALDLPGTISIPVTTNDQGQVASEVVTTIGQVTVTIPAGVQLVPGTNNLPTSVAEVEESGANIQLSENEVMRALDVHIGGIDANNTVPMIIDLGEALPAGLNLGNYTLYHVEGEDTNPMTKVDSLDQLDAHNEFFYDPATGNVVLAMASFSEVAMVANEENAWNGVLDYEWYDADATELTIANADQLAAFGAIVGGMKKVTGRVENKYTYSEERIQDSFSDKTVKLIADINIGDTVSDNDLVFYPIGYWNNEGTYERKPVEERETAVDSGLYTFNGTFDGNGHTISNFYHNTWEMKGDHNWYDPVKEQYYRDGMGLFGRVYKGTIKNLTVKNFKSDGEIATTGVIAAYADGATFENITIFDCNPRVYNIGNGGIVGCVGWYAKEEGLKTTFKNITVDNSNKISALWGSYDVACGGIVGQYYPTSGQTSAGTPANGGISFENCHIAAQMDVYNDVCGNYQYYAYRYAGMLIGSVRENETIDGHVYPKMDGITASGCTVHFGTWNDYYYCEFEKNGHPSYSGPDDYKFSRMEHSDYNFTDSNGNGLIDTDAERESMVCNHTHSDVEDNRGIYLPFNNLVTGYGWGVTTKVVGELEGVTILDREVADSVDKFVAVSSEKHSVTAGTEYTVGKFFAEKEDNTLAIQTDKVHVFVSPVDKDNVVYVEYSADEKNWADGKLKFFGTGEAIVTITDYYFCNPCTITITVEESGNIYRVGNVGHQNGNTVDDTYDVTYAEIVKLLTGKAEYSSIAVETAGQYKVDVEVSSTKVNFTGTGLVVVKINGVAYPLEVVDAVNTNSATSATTNNVVLLNDCGLSSLTVDNGYAFYGNGFRMTYTGNGQYLGKGSGFKFGVVNVSGGGKLDNCRIQCSIYPIAALYSDQIANYYEKDGDKTRYFYQLSAVAISGNSTISNCYIYGGRNNVYVGSGNVVIEDSVMESGTVSNIQIVSSKEYTVTLDGVTTIQTQVKPTTYANENLKNNTMLGFGVLVGDGDGDGDATTNPKLVLMGAFKQYNWVTSADKKAVTDTYTQGAIEAALGESTFAHTINGTKAANMGIVFLNTEDTNIENKTDLTYSLASIKIATVTGRVYSLSGAADNQIYFDAESADRNTVNDTYAPQFRFNNDLGKQYIEKTEDGDEFCYREGNTIKVMFPAGDTKELDLAALVSIVKYTGQDLNQKITCKDSKGNEVELNNNKIALSAAETYTVTYQVTDGTSYSWTITVDVTLKDTAIPDAFYEFDSSVQKIYRSGNSSIVQFIPFLSGLKIYDYHVDGTEYLRFDGGNTSATTDYDKIAKASIENINTTGEGQGYHIVTIEFTDGGKLVIDMDVRANSGSSTHSGSIKVRNNVLYVVNGGTTSGKGQTWKIYSYKFVGNNGTEINSGLVTFGTAGVDCDTATKPSSNFGTTVKSTVTYDANGGNCGQTLSYATSAATDVDLPTPTRSGYIFAGWYTAASGGTRVGGAGDSYTPSANITLYAQWGKPCNVTYNANGGSCGTASEKYTGTALTLPTPTRDGYWFVGWYDAAEGGEKIGDAGATYNPGAEITLYAHWQEAIKYTVTYNANGGSCGTASATYEGTALTLPTPTRTGYTFNGWYTATSGGTKIGDAGAAYIPSANITLYAQWKINSYQITLSISNASVTVNGKAYTGNATVSVEYGSTVSVTLNKFTENSSKKFTIKSGDNSVNVNDTSTGKSHSFNMPASEVTITASSSGSCVASDTLVTLADGTQKRIDQVTYADKLLVWDFDKGEYTYANSSIIENHGYDMNEVIKLTFEDGTSIKVVNVHGFFDADLNKWVDINADNAADYVGHSFTQVDGDTYKTVKLVSAEASVEYVEAWSILTADQYNCVLEGMFSITPPATEQLAYFEIGEDMKYDAEKKQADIEKYGLYTYEEWAHLMTEQQFEAFNFAEIKIAVGKGLITYDELIALLASYA